MKYWEYPRSIGIKFHGCEVPCCMKMLSSYRQQKSTSSQIRYSVSEAKLQIIHNHTLLLIVSLSGIDGEPVVFEWKIFPGHTSLKLLQEVQNMMEKDNLQPESFKDRIILMSMYNDIDWGRNEKAMKNIAYRIPEVFPNTPKGFPKDFGHSSDLDLKKMVCCTRK